MKKVVQEQLECAKAATKSVEASMSSLNKYDEQYKEFTNIQTNIMAVEKALTGQSSKDLKDL